MAQQAQLSPQQRAALFTQATRQNRQVLATRSAQGELETLTFDLPKARLLSKVTLFIEAVVNVKATTGTSVAIAPTHGYELLRRVQVDLNNGFSPFVVSGRGLFGYSLLRLNPDVILSQKVTKRAVNYIENAASAAGVDNKVAFSVELPITLNDRDPVGLIMLQNNETNVQVKVDVDQVAKIYKLNSGNGETATFKSLKVTPVIETFTIPAVQEAFPDISVLKLVSEKSEVLQGSGQTTVKLNTGNIYRRMLIYVEDANGVPLADADFAGNIELVFNQADIPYSEPALSLAHTAHRQLGYPLPDGWFVLDFTFQGLPGYGGSRDYIDTERLTEFWLRVNTSKAGKITVVSENLSRLV